MPGQSQPQMNKQYWIPRVVSANSTLAQNVEFWCKKKWIGMRLKAIVRQILAAIWLLWKVKKNRMKSKVICLVFGNWMMLQYI